MLIALAMARTSWQAMHVAVVSELVSSRGLKIEDMTFQFEEPMSPLMLPTSPLMLPMSPLMLPMGLEGN